MALTGRFASCSRAAGYVSKVIQMMTATGPSIFWVYPGSGLGGCRRRNTFMALRMSIDSPPPPHIPQLILAALHSPGELRAHRLYEDHLIDLVQGRQIPLQQVVPSLLWNTWRPAIVLAERHQTLLLA